MTDKHNRFLKHTFINFALQEISKRIKEPSLDVIDLIMYFGSQEARVHINEVVLPELVTKLPYIALIRLEERLYSYNVDFCMSHYTVEQEIKLRKKQVGV